MNQELVTRFQEGYRAAGSAIRFGNGVRAFGCLLGAAGVFGGWIAAANGNNRIGFWLFIGGLLTALLLSIIGVLVAVQGRILRATLDTSVAGHPMLAPHERAHVMDTGV